MKPGNIAVALSVAASLMSMPSHAGAFLIVRYRSRPIV